ncbi:hypothetical protein H2203_006862 [Taxawa tesnikishii (nom. ined.)]|nr:hypothetical protein H2203_006862 [Dothideales sp. JES 119]
MARSQADSTDEDYYRGAPLTAQVILVLISLSISLYNSIELLLLIFITFKRWSGLYFWSLLVATLAIIPYSCGYVVSYFQINVFYAYLILNNAGWPAMITGQAFVLYSRLHLVLHDQRILRAVLVMIIIDAIIFHIPTIVLNVCSNYASNPFPAAEGYKVYEKVQMTAFCIQEFIISGLYMWKTGKLLRVVLRDDTRRTMWQLFSINVIIIIMDLALLAVEYVELRVEEQVLKAVVYSVKLKLEYAILSKLVHLVESGGSVSSSFGELERSGSNFLARPTSVTSSKNAARRAFSPSAFKDSKHDGGVQHVEQAYQAKPQTHFGGIDPIKRVEEPPMARSHGHVSQGSRTSKVGRLEEEGEDLYAIAVRQLTQE